MAYPKPLSQKSLDKLYQQSGLSARQIEFLHAFFLACANLYGATPMREVWQVYTEAAKKRPYPTVHRKDLLAFSAIVRREDQPYYVFEADELYTEEPRADLSREIVSKELIGGGYGKLMLYYRLMEEIGPEPYYIPDDILSFADPQPNEEEAALTAFIGNLKATARQCSPRHEAPYPNENRGKRLSEFSFLNRSELFEESYYSKKPAILAQLRAETAGSEADKILRLFKRAENIGRLHATDHLQDMLDELSEVGVELSDLQLNRLVALINDYHNHSHLWCISGWSPRELSKYYYGDNRRPAMMSFGPGMQKAFRDGSMNKDELIAELRKMGIDVVDP